MILCLCVNLNPYLKTMKLTILIVENDYHNYLYLAELLSETGSTILHAQNGKEAVTLCTRNSEISLVFMDIKMPVMDGVEATKLIRMIRPNLPIIAQTAYALNNEIAKFSYIFDGYITKPINEAELKDEVHKFVYLPFE